MIGAGYEEKMTIAGKRGNQFLDLMKWHDPILIAVDDKDGLRQCTSRLIGMVREAVFVEPILHMYGRGVLG